MPLIYPLRRTSRLKTLAMFLALAGFAVALGRVALARAADRPHDLASRRTSLVNGDLLSAAGTRAASVVDDLRRGATWFAPADVDTLPSPGMMIGVTFWDAQHNYSQGHQVAANPGSNTVHFVWTESDIFCLSCDPWDPYVNYNSYDVSTGMMNQGFNGVSVSLGEFARAAMPRIDVDGDNLAHLVFHQRIEVGFPYTNWHLLFPTEGSPLNEDSMLTPNPRHDAGDLWPDVAIEQRSGFKLLQFPQSGTNVRHVIGSGGIAAGGGTSYPSGLISYWRFDEAAPAPAWEGPVIVDSSDDLSYVIDAADDRGKVAVAFTSDWWTDGFNELNNVAYHESQTSGVGWIDGTELGPAFRYLITSYDDPEGPQAWPYVSVAYDHQGTLHIVWTEQRVANVSEQTAICHWNSVRQTVRPVAAGYYDNPHVWGKSLNLSQVTLGIGDGSTLCKDGAEANLDYLYVVYMKLGGETPEEQADVSKAGFANGELYLSASGDGGHSWSPPDNLSNTKTPGCTSTRPDSVCASEAWATIARDVDEINIFYIADFEAGSFSESGWTMNRTFYLQLEGGTTNAEYVCPRLAPNILTTLTADPECEYHAAPGMTNEELLTVGNLGNIALTGEVTVLPADSWLNVVAGPFEIEPTEPDLEYPVIMDAAGLTEGLYSGLIHITHNDTSKPSPLDYPIDFFVVDDFHCPEATILRTAVFGDPGVLSLQVGTDGRFGAPDPDGGLLRPLDSSSAIFDATLLVAHGEQDPDTVVYHRFYNSDDLGQHGFRSLAALYIDTLAYGEGDGYAKARAEMTTKDSAIAIRAEWYYPQGSAYGDFVILKYTLSNLTSEPLAGVAVGIYADFNVMAAQHVRAIQDGVGNHGNYIPAQNLIYLYGYDTIGHVPSDHSNSSQRYSAGITYLAGRDADGASFALEGASMRGGVGDNRDNNLTTGLYYGPTSAHLYESLVGNSGVSIWEPIPHADSVKDAYMWLTLDQGRTLEPNGANPEVYVVALVSDTLQHPAYSIDPKLAGGLTEVVDSAWSWASFRYPCGCSNHGDPQPDGVTNVLDVVQCVNVAFRGAPPVFDDDCEWQRTDVDCTGYTDVLDVVHFVNVAFRSGDPREEFPCVCY